MNARFRFTIFTPTYNSASYIHRVFESLESQTFKDFEWLVIDDGSQDETVDLLERYREQANFEIVVISKPENKGLMNSFNVATDLARGEFFLPAGHDDRFDADALEVFDREWRNIPEDRRATFSGVTGLCRTEAGEVHEPFPAEVIDCSSLEMYYRYKIRNEKWGFQRTEVMRAHKFPESYRYVMESAFVWFPIGQQFLTRYINRPLRTYYRDNKGSLSQSRTIRYADGMAASYERLLGFAMAYPKSNLGEILMSAGRYVRFSLHAGQSLSASIGRLRGPQRWVVLLGGLPLGVAMVLLDRQQRRI